MKNPFDILTPEDTSAEDIHSIFVDVFTDFHQVPKIGHAFLNGPRGSGKSMMFRYMMPDCQKIRQGCTLKDLDYFSLYIPIKLTDFNYGEYDKLKENANNFINEHLLITFIAAKCFQNIIDLKEDDISVHKDDLVLFFNNSFLWFLEISGFNAEHLKNTSFNTSEEVLKLMVTTLDKIFIECKRYCKDLAINPNKPIDYNGALCNFLDFLLPLFKEFKNLKFMPEGPIFLLIDDAGYLTVTQTQILNTWVSFRASKFISIKISTQLDYKSFKTVTNKTIDSPHDYSEVNISDIYTSPQNDYHKRVEEIVEKRLEKYLLKKIKADDFFPPDIPQQVRIAEIRKKLEVIHKDDSKKHAAGDAGRRYATSDFFKEISKNSSTYSYAGFDNLVNISSGIVRHFLEPASIMFAHCAKGSDDISFIPPSDQNLIINEYSRKFLDEEFAKVYEEHGTLVENDKLSKADKLYNLITGFGELCKKIFMSERTERIVFSIGLYDLPNKPYSFCNI